MVQNTLEGVKNIYITFYLSSQVKTGHKICVSVANWCHSVATKPIHFLPGNLSLKYKGSWLSWSLTTSKEDHEFDSFALLVIGEEIAKTPTPQGNFLRQWVLSAVILAVAQSHVSGTPSNFQCAIHSESGYQHASVGWEVLCGACNSRMSVKLLN